MTYIVGVDIGGTFTDCIVLKSAADGSAVIMIGKASSTPPDFLPCTFRCKTTTDLKGEHVSKARRHRSKRRAWLSKPPV